MAKQDTQQRTWTLAEIAEEVGGSARTVRFYISRGLMAGPEKAGRGATYGQAHVDRLREIQRLQADGLTLAEIAVRGQERESVQLPEPEAWWSYAVGDGVEVRVRADQAPWRLRQIRRLLSELGSQLEETEKTSTK
jgi:DNA-binding transcriptional MerR regulator